MKRIHALKCNYIVAASVATAMNVMGVAFTVQAMAKSADNGYGASVPIPPTSTTLIDGVWRTFMWSGVNVFNNEGAYAFSSSNSVLLKITDCYLDGDQFEVFDNGVSLGVTSTPTDDGYNFSGSYDDAFVNSKFSHGSYVLPPGSHSITIKTIACATGYTSGGAGIQFSPIHLHVRAPCDFDGDGKSDLALFTKSTGYWDVMPSSGGTNLHFKFGGSSTQPAVADYDGDTLDDVALRNNSTLKWYISRSSSTLVTTNWGGADTIAVPADYDGDGKADPATYRPGDGRWVIGFSSDGTVSKMIWGRNTGIPVMADYNGDGKTDRAIYQRFTSKWYIFNSDGTTNLYQWGWSKTMPVPGDYDGDGKADIGVYAPSNGTWYVKCSGGTTIVQQWGNSKSIPAPGDYDGDGVTDMAVYRPSNATWYIRLSSGGTQQIQFGNTLAAPATLQSVLNRKYYPTP